MINLGENIDKIFFKQKTNELPSENILSYSSLKLHPGMTWALTMGFLCLIQAFKTFLAA